MDEPKRLLVVSTLTVLAVASLCGTGEAATASTVTATASQLPVYFIENRGQLDARVRYYVMGSDATVYFTPGGITFAQTDGDLRWAVEQEFLGANLVTPVARRRTETLISYFKGPQKDWKTGLPTYAEVVYPDLWPGIDLVYSGQGSRLKYSFLVNPGGDPRRIRIAYHGVTDIGVSGAGELHVLMPTGGYGESQPYAYQGAHGRRAEVSAAFQVRPDELTGTQVVGFAVGPYDRGAPLVIDPVTTVYCGYIGEGAQHQNSGIAVDVSGNAYLTGATASSEFPVTVGPDVTFNGNSDVFVAKVNATGTALVYAGYIGGAETEWARDIAVDGFGNAFVVGQVNADAPNSFPVTVGPDVTFNGGYMDAFVAKVDATGTALVYAGFIGGAEMDTGNSIAVDGSGNAYVTGWTTSNQTSFPVKGGPDLTYGGDYDAFVAKVNVDGTAFVYAGYIGGNQQEGGAGIAVGGSGNAYVTGWTTSDQTSFPVKGGPDLTYGGNYDAFVAKVNEDGTALIYAGYIGGTGFDGFSAGDIAVDGSGNAYVTGNTDSDESSFPVTVGPDLRYDGGVGGFPSDAFVAKVNAAGTSFVYAGYLGGTGNDLGFGIAVDASGNAYVTGMTSSNEASFPVTVGPDLTFNGVGVYRGDAFVAKVNADGTALEYAGYLGGTSDDGGYGIAVDASGNAFVVGVTSSSEASFPVTVGPDLTFNGGADNAFLCKISVTCPDPVLGDACDADDDNDGILDPVDNCPILANSDQDDLDLDGLGDACDADDDNDGILDPVDNCPINANPDQFDDDGDRLGDACDNDSDGDGILDPVDNCPILANSDQADLDLDALGDACDPDDDGDGILDPVDNCPILANSDQSDLDADAFGDRCDTDRDGDTVLDAVDNCATIANLDQVDLDADGSGDACEPDDDGDGLPDGLDNCPRIANLDQADHDTDQLGDACDPDDDGDGIPDGLDNCRLTASTDLADPDGDGMGDPCDPDDDGDGRLDPVDNCALDVNPGQEDLDHDGLGDACDPTLVVDTDRDGVLDLADNCLSVANSSQVDTDGDGRGDACDDDLDGDTFANADDDCPTLVDIAQTDSDGDGRGDACDDDDDGDTVPDDTDNCSVVANSDQTNTDGNIDGGDACDRDDDDDRAADGEDTCPVVFDPDQVDTDVDRAGDACDDDDDNDTVLDPVDNCPVVANDDQANSDEDIEGDACDRDDDNDGVVDVVDTCPTYPDRSNVDTDGDGKGDVCDEDKDGDRFPNMTDNCPEIANASQFDVDADGMGDACDDDHGPVQIAGGGGCACRVLHPSRGLPSGGLLLSALCFLSARSRRRRSGPESPTGVRRCRR